MQIVAEKAKESLKELREELSNPRYLALLLTLGVGISSIGAKSLSEAASETGKNISVAVTLQLLAEIAYKLNLARSIQFPDTRPKNITEKIVEWCRWNRNKPQEVTLSSASANITQVEEFENEDDEGLSRKEEETRPEMAAGMTF